MAGVPGNSEGVEAQGDVVVPRGRSGSSRRRRHRSPSNAPRVRHEPPVPPPSPPPREIINLSMLRFLFMKQLMNSDVSAAGRIVIPKHSAELHLPTLHVKEGFWIHMEDLNYLKVWTFKYRFWPNNRSRMYIIENTKDFITLRGLCAGDFIEIYQEDQTGLYVIRGRKNYAVAL